MQSTEVLITVLSNDEATPRALAALPLRMEGVAEDEIVVRGPSRVPGAMGGWYELAVALGVLSLPASVVSGCLSTWIASALAKPERPSDQSVRAKMVIQRGERVAEVELTAENPGALGAAIRSALDSVDFE